MPEEIERKFLLDQLPAWVAQSPAQQLEQGYLALEAGGQEVRLRKGDGRHWLTVKAGDGLSRKEYETELEASQFEAIWPATAGRRIRKSRYTAERSGVVFEIDVYHEPLRGLIVAEVEFVNEESALAFVPPDWLGQEVTHFSFLKNRELFRFASVKELRERL